MSPRLQAHGLQYHLFGSIAGIAAKLLGALWKARRSVFCQQPRTTAVVYLDPMNM